jgi:Tol biopolymer transport system component
LAKDVSERYATAEDFIGDLQELFAEIESADNRMPVPEKKRFVPSAENKPGFRRPVVWTVMMGLLLPALFFGLRYLNRPLSVPREENFAVRAQRITNRGRCVRSVIAPDGRSTAYVLEENGEQALYLHDLENNQVKTLLPPADRRASGISFSPDGRQLFLSARASGEDNNTLYRLSLADASSGPQKILENLENAADLSPDGRQFAFLRLSNDDTHEEILLANADGTGERVVYERRMPDYIPHLTQPVWSPDGRKLLFSGGVYNQNKQQAHPFVLDVEAGRTEQMFQDSWEEIWHLDWLPETKGFILSGRRTKSQNNKQLWLVSYPEGEISRLTEDYNDYYGASAAVENGRLKISSIVLNRVAQLWRTELADPNFQPLSLTAAGNYGLGLTQTPDGRIFVGSTNSGNPDVWSMNRDGEDLRLLTTTPQLDSHPVATADGRYLVFSSERSGIKTLWRMKPDGTEQMPLVERATIENFALSPDGKNIFYYSYFEDQGALWRVGIDGSNREKVIDGRYESPAVAPDGKTIAAVYKKDEDSKYELAVQSLADRVAPRLLKLPDGAQLPGPVTWAADGQSLIYVINQKGVGNLWRHDLDGRTPRQLTFFNAQRLFYFTLSPDENEAVCARGMVEGYSVLLSFEVPEGWSAKEKY